MDISKLILKIIREIKEDENIQIDSNLRDIGINSIQFIQIMVNIETEIGIEFPDEFLIFAENVTANTFAEIVTNTIENHQE